MGAVGVAVPVYYTPGEEQGVVPASNISFSCARGPVVHGRLIPGTYVIQVLV